MAEHGQGENNHKIDRKTDSGQRNHQAPQPQEHQKGHNTYNSDKSDGMNRDRTNDDGLHELD
ncbi:hypothetical protein GSbR_29160 [Geobacter sp. SVR]|nr:hypothetical protein GSVR_22130 [Geobacter sp. SVR]GCF86316.1 hypothetical protein GSbR_29160 [Geobacter sp. SVR]